MRPRGRDARVRKVLRGDGIDPIAFGERSRAAVTLSLVLLLGRGPSKPYHATGVGGGVDHEIQWPGLTVFFARGRFVGYSYSPPNKLGRETARPSAWDVQSPYAPIATMTP